MPEKAPVGQITRIYLEGGGLGDGLPGTVTGDGIGRFSVLPKSIDIVKL